MSKQNIIIVGSITLLIGLGVGFYAGKADKEKKNVAMEGQKTQNTQACNEDISNWQTYKNEKYGFEVKYPGGEVIDNGDKSIKFPEGGIIKEIHIVSLENTDPDNAMTQYRSIFDEVINAHHSAYIGMRAYGNYVTDFIMSYDDSRDNASERLTREALVLYVQGYPVRDVILIKELENLKRDTGDRYLYEVQLVPTMEAHAYATEEGIKKLISFDD